ncbi:MAG: hypothetical protein AABY97_08975 [Chloroflexota bacterium]
MRRNYSKVTREVVELVFPGLGHAGVTVYEKDGPLDPLRPQIHNAQVGRRQPGIGTLTL